MLLRKKPPEPVHVPGTVRGEEVVLDKGHEPGRGDRKYYRTARDSTGVNANDRNPILASMPNIPPI
jgi:hypothetical protein